MRIGPSSILEYSTASTTWPSLPDYITFRCEVVARDVGLATLLGGTSVILRRTLGIRRPLRANTANIRIQYFLLLAYCKLLYCSVQSREMMGPLNFTYWPLQLSEVRLERQRYKGPVRALSNAFFTTFFMYTLVVFHTKGTRRWDHIHTKAS